MVGSTEGLPGLLERRTAEAQVLGTAVGWILRETMAVHRGPHALENNWFKGKFWAPLVLRYYYHRFLSTKLRMRQYTCQDDQAKPWIMAALERVSGPVLGTAGGPSHPGSQGPPHPTRQNLQRGSRATSVPGHPLHCPGYCLFQK